MFYELREVSDGQITPTSTVDVISDLNWDSVYPLAGPTYIKGAEPGDALEIEVLDIGTLGWGWSAIIPGFGLLEEEFTEPKLMIWDLSRGSYAYFRHDIKIPLDPFCGTMGVAPAEEGEFDVMPPGRHGGNLDVKHITKRSRLFLPVCVKGALFSLGDGHAAQGDGEVCVTAVEAPLHVSLKFEVKKGLGLVEPRLITPALRTSVCDERGYYVTLGRSADLMDAAKSAVRQMVDYLSCEHRMERWEAYMLCSIVVDLRISEIVDKPNWIVSAFLPQSIFQ